MNIDRPTELRRLALVLHKSEGQLGYLDSLDGAALMKLRTQLQTSLLDRFSNLFEKLANSGKLAPDALSALLCKKVFGPSLTANMSYYVPTDRSVKMCKHFDESFMADIARNQIPERAKDQLENLPVDLMKGVTRELIKSKDYPIMGGFTDHLPEDKGQVLMKEIDDPADNIRISSFAQRKDRIARLAVSMNDTRLKQLIEAAFQSEAFIHEVGLVTAEMSADEQTRMAKLTDSLNPAHRPKAKQLAQASGIAPRMQAYFAA